MRALATVLILSALCAVLPGWPAARAATLGEARIGFSAERVLVVNGRRFVGPMWQMPGVQRQEQQLPAIKPVFLLFADRPYGEVLLPQLHTVVQIPLPRAFALLDDPRLLRHPVGHQTIDGIATTKYAVAIAAPAGRATGSLWLSRDGIAMRCDAVFRARGGQVATIHWELHDVRIGPQPAVLFTVPRGYKLLPAAAVAPLLGLRLPKPRRADPAAPPR
ncbi:MAG: hypothetical protein ACREE1_14100 [Stellaceae bacterium]